MAFEVVMPRLGWNMEEGTVVGWRKKDGDTVTAGETLFEVESDKAVQEVEALESGILRIPSESPSLGTQVPVGTLLAYLLQPGEELPTRKIPEIREPATPVPELFTESETPLPAEKIWNTPAPRSENQRLAISPRAKRVAGELGVDPSALLGSGRSGRIVERDVRTAAEVSAAVADSALPFGHAVPISPVRRSIARTMSESAHTSAAVTVTTEVDATELVNMRNQFKKRGNRPVPSFTDLFVKLVSQALVDHPRMNARFEADRIVESSTVNVGIAIDTERGLFVPVIRNAQTKSLNRIAEESAVLIAHSRGGHVDHDRLQGGTFTITNLGMYGIDSFTPIINLPECAILGVGRIVAKQVVTNAEPAEVKIRHMMFLSLTFDHRLVDGAPAARFMQGIKEYVEKPYLWLAGS